MNRKKEISWHAVYYHFRKWSHDGSHALAKKCGESVACQGRKKGKTTNILPIAEGQGFT